MFSKKDIRKEFLPSAIEIIETPPSPLGKLTIWLVTALILTAIAWSIIGEVDEVTIAKAQIIPEGKISTVEVVEGGIVKEMYVGENDYVEVGQIVGEIDDSALLKEREKFREVLDATVFERNIVEYMLSGNDEELENAVGKLDSFKEYEKVMALYKSYKDIREEHFKSQELYYDLSIDKLLIDKSQAKLDIEQMELAYQQALDEYVASKELYDAGSISEKEFEEKEYTKKRLFSELEKSKQKLDSIDESINLSSNEKSKLYLSFRENLMKDAIDMDKKIREYNTEIDKLNDRINKMTVRSSVNGVVQNLGVNNKGEVIEAGKAFVTVVPSDATLMAEVQVNNQDIGFIKIGQNVDIKVDAFPYQKFGTIEGELINISPDANFLEGVGYVYKAKVKISSSVFSKTGETYNLQSGMTATVEVKTGKRRIIDFFLPGIDYIQDSFKLR